MYYYLNGIPALVQPNLAVIDCGGVGYKCYITLNTSKAISGKEKVKLFTYLSVKEDALDLYGFADEQELQFFQLLISISGVGPKVALAILSELTPAQFASCVLSNNIKGITKAPGVGQKLAQRICLELKDKIAKTSVESSDSEEFDNIQSQNEKDDAVAVLIALGYSKNDAQAAVSKCSADNTNDIVTQALRFLSRMV